MGFSSIRQGGRRLIAGVLGGGLLLAGLLGAIGVQAAGADASAAAAAAPAQPSCQFVLGFAALHSRIPLAVGNCIDDQAFAPNGDAIQHTQGGLLVWRKADNATAFTDGFRTWMQQPGSLLLRMNNERFSNEPDAGAAGTTTLKTTFPTAAPSLTDISALMSRTVEVNTPSEHFALLGAPITVSDGGMGTITAAVGVRFPTADAKGHILFFWHNQAFVGMNSTEAIDIRGLSSFAPGVVTASYANYGPNDPVCCPSHPPLTLTYAWNGSVMVASGTPPVYGNKPVTVTLKG